MKKIIVSLMVFSLGIFFLVSCTENKEPKNDSAKLRVGVTINPLKEFTEIIGGDKIEVFSIIPEGSEPHDFEPKTRDLKDLSDSDIFIYNGLGMEEWIDSVTNVLKEKDILMIDSSKNVDTITTDGKVDPHVWLSLKEASKQAESIKDALIKKDPENSAVYNDNFNKLKDDFDKLYNEYKLQFENLKMRDFVTGHAAFGYLCRDFNLVQKSIEDVYGEGEPTPQKFEELIKYCRENNIKVIFSESQASPENSETLARDAGAKVEKIYSLESKEDGKTYLEGMKYDLDKILESLK